MEILIILTLEYFIFLALIGIFVGLSSGLLGVGGGFIMVPLQFFLLTHYGVNSDYALITSLATSLAVIIPTSLSSIYKHNKVLDNILIPGIKLGIFGIFGGFIGGVLAVHLPTNILKLIFALLLFALSFKMFFNKDFNFSFKFDLNLLTYLIIGVGVGILSGLLGIGGGIFIVTILSSLLGFSLLEAIGISSVFICLTAVGGVISYIINGVNNNVLPYSVGYVNLMNFLGIIIFSIPFAYIGANISHKIKEEYLEKIFAVLIFVIAIAMLL